MLPNFIIIGAQKSATTFLQFCISDHPDAFIPSDEIAFFEDPEYQRTDLKDFEDIFDEAHNKKAIGIKRPNYLANPKCPTRIKELLPDAKLVVILRNPVERFKSAYYHYIRYGFIPPHNINKGMSYLLSGKYKDKYPRSSEIIEFGFYYKHLKEYFSIFDTNQILILFYDDIKNDALEQVRRVYKFLEIDESYVPKRIKSKPQRNIYSINWQKFLTFTNRIRFSYNSDMTRLYMNKANTFNKIISRTIYLIEVVLKSRFFSNDLHKSNNDLNRKLFSIYETDLEHLESLLGLPLTHWKIDSRKAQIL